LPKTRFPMNKIYNLKQETKTTPEQTTEQLSKLKMNRRLNRRKNEILNGFVFLIGLVGFVAVFMLPRDGVYSNSNLENSFSNSSPLASSSLAINQVNEEEEAIEFITENPVKINGFFEAEEVLEFELESYQPNSEVVYTIHFGNGAFKEIQDKITFYKYPAAGNFDVKITAKYKEDTKQIFHKKIAIDDAIIVNSEAFVEVH